MSDWRDRILREFTPGIQPITAVADPDGLVTEPRLIQSLTERGFETLVFEDAISFRFAYESRFRGRLETKDHTDLVVLVRDQQATLFEKLPFDVLANGRTLSFSLAEVFPQFSYPVLRDLEPQDLDMLYEAQNRFSPGTLGENATRDFILRHVFGLAAELIKTDADLLRTLLRRHYRRQSIPHPFVERVAHVLEQDGRFGGWQLKELLADRSLFFAFLQERWPAFLSLSSGEARHESHFAVPGPEQLPFDDPDIRVYIDNLFVEGMLQPVAWKEIPSGWAAIGVFRDPTQDTIQRLLVLLDLVQREIPSEDARHGDWLSFARTWAESNLLSNEAGVQVTSDVMDRLSNVRRLVDARFHQWLSKRFGSLHSLPASPPVMVHHVSRFLAAQLDHAAKVALIVVDGLAFDQWLVIRHELNRQRPEWRFDESAMFAWVPTITSVSRQAIFAGKAPFYFPSSIYSTSREESLWHQFWADHSLASQEVAYVKGLGDRWTLDSVQEALSEPKRKVLGAVVDKVDRIMHGMELGAAGMHNQVRQWAAEGFLAALFDLLLTRGFVVFLTADHGNVESLGCGRPKEGLTADVRGERARIYSDPVLRANVASRFPAAVSWEPIGLPEEFLPLLSADRSAFVPDGYRTVAHGGVTVEETIVPFIRIVGGKS